MSTTALANRIQSLPADLQKQVADFVEFLILKYQLTGEGKSELTEEQKAELLELWEGYKKNPDDVISVDTLREQTKAKYGL